MSKPRAIAFYLPQFYPTSENDQWWAKGFTEWTNVGNAKPLFKNHYQPHLPTETGFYDLRLPEARQLQADMAKEAGLYMVFVTIIIGSMGISLWKLHWKKYLSLVSLISH